MKMQIKTKNTFEISRKPRVYFTCHPDDFDRYFTRITEDILKTQDCAIYYTDDMTASFGEDIDLELGYMNLFVVPVTAKLLLEDNRAMQLDIPYAIAHGIRILPMMMEEGIEGLYARPDKFGNRQYICPHTADLTEIPYEQKLQRFLDEALFDDALARRVRAAFDAYIFLSYRKKDRRHANALMRLIHQNPKYRDIAIWYDEFITLGEDFRTNILQALSSSRLFALLVTPSLLEDPNFVKDEEYPTARASGIGILPVEMVSTDQGELEKCYESLPACVSAQDNDSLYARFADMLTDIAVADNDDDPLHNYLIGIAYLEGIDVEVDRARGMALLERAAEGDCPEAMDKLIDILNTRGAYTAAKKWAERLYAYRCNAGEGRSLAVAHAACRLAEVCTSLGSYGRAKELLLTALDIRTEKLGKNDLDVLTLLASLSYVCGKLGDYEGAMKIAEGAYQAFCKQLGAAHRDTLYAAHHLSIACGNAGEYARQVAICEELYQQLCSTYGGEHELTVSTLHELAKAYSHNGQYALALSTAERAYHLIAKIHGKAHPNTIGALSTLATEYGQSGQHERALELHREAYQGYCRTLGTEHPKTLTALSNLSYAHGRVGNYEKKVALDQKAYRARCRVLGKAHPDTLVSLSNLAFACGRIGQFEKKLALNRHAYALRCKVLGKEHPDTLMSLNNLGNTYNELHQYRAAIEHLTRAHQSALAVLGEKHPDTVRMQMNICAAHRGLGEYTEALALCERVLALRTEIYGEQSTVVFDTLEYHIKLCEEAGATDRLAALYARSASLAPYARNLGERTAALGRFGQFAMEHGDFLRGYNTYMTLHATILAAAGEDHQGALAALFNASICAFRIDRRDIAITLAEKAYLGFARALGENHPQTKYAKDYLDMIK